MAFPLRRVLDPQVEPVTLSAMKNYLRVDITDDDALIGSLISVARERAEDMTSRCLLPQQFAFAFDRFPSWGWAAWGNDDGQWGNHNHKHTMFKSAHLAIILPRGPVISVDSIKYVDQSGTVQTLDPTLYNADLLSEPARITPIHNGSWPSALYDTNSVTITFTAGYQQTVTELVTMPQTAPFTAALQRGALSVSLTSCVDNTTKVAVSGALSGGILTCAGATAGEVLLVSYVVTSVPQSFIHAIKLLCDAWYNNRSEVVQGSGNFNSMPMPVSATSLLGTYQLFPVGYPRG